MAVVLVELTGHKAVSHNGGIQWNKNDILKQSLKVQPWLWFLGKIIPQLLQHRP